MGHDQQRGAGPGDVLITSSTSCTISGSSADVGSSNSSSSGCMARARAMATRCCCPPDSWPGRLCWWSRRPTRSSRARPAPWPRARTGHARAPAPAPRPERAHVREQVELLEHHADLGAHARQAPVVAHRDAVDLDAAAVIGFQQVHAAHQRRLAGPGRADEGDDLATGHVQVDAVQRGEGAVVFSSAQAQQRGGFEAAAASASCGAGQGWDVHYRAPRRLARFSMALTTRTSGSNSSRYSMAAPISGVGLA